MSSSVVAIKDQRDLDSVLARGGKDRIVVLYFTATW